jgi:hypothetical protein
MIAGLTIAWMGSAPVSAESTIVVPAKAGAVEGTTENSDAFIWRLFTEFAAPAFKSRPSPVVFETWASDEDTFSTKPQWPGADAPRKLHACVPESEPTTSPHQSAIDVACGPPKNAAVGGFPTTGPPTPCIAEENKRNYDEFKYIVENNLNTKAGLAAAFAKSFKVAMPMTSIAIKGDWVPVQTLLQWLPELSDIGNIEKLYYTTTAASVEYALVSLHVSSRQNANWVWGTFEHRLNPGRCDTIGCFDSFGAETPAVLPNKAAANSQYGACPKTKLLKALMDDANLSPVWENYCLKSTEVDYAAADGTPYVLGNSVIERIVGNGAISAASCIACHVYASFGLNGSPTASASAMLSYNPSGNPVPSVLAGSLQFDFMWGVMMAP